MQRCQFRQTCNTPKSAEKTKKSNTTRSTTRPTRLRKYCCKEKKNAFKNDSTILINAIIEKTIIFIYSCKVSLLTTPPPSSSRLVTSSDLWLIESKMCFCLFFFELDQLEYNKIKENNNELTTRVHTWFYNMLERIMDILCCIYSNLVQNK